MLKNYIKIAFRSFKKNKTYSGINIFGLAIGISAFIFITLFIQDEISYDKFHENSDRIYRVTGSYDRGEDARVQSALTTYVLGPQIAFQFPQIEKAVRISPNNISTFLIDGEYIQQENIIYADSGFFDVFSFPLTEGSTKNLFQVANEAVVSEKTALKLFGSKSPIGLTLESDGTFLTVVGVMKEFPENSHFDAEMIVSIATVHDQYPDWIRNNWSGTSHYTYALLSKNTDPGLLESEINTFWDSNVQDYGNLAEYADFALQPLAKIHLESNLVNEIEANGDITYIYLFGIVGLVILIIAAINYMNLATAQSITRTTEVGIRKVLGAESGHVKKQFLSESIIISSVSFFIGVISVELLLPYFNQITGKNIAIAFPESLPFLVGIFGVMILIGLVSGSYPSFWLSRLNIIRTIKSNNLGANKGGELLKRGLVTFQFTISAVVLISTILVSKQLEYIQNKKLGINPEEVVVFPLQSNDIVNRYDEIKSELVKESWVTSVTATNNSMPGRVSNWRPYRLDGVEDDFSLPTIIIHDDFLETLEAEIIEGRGYAIDRTTDVASSYVINEAAAALLGLEEPVGTKLTGRTFTGSEWGTKDAEIIGVVKNFHFTSLHDEIQPVVFSLYSEATTDIATVAVRVKTNNFEQAIASLEATWDQFSNGEPFFYSFLDQDIASLYEAEKRFLLLFSVFSTLAIIISCLGILGLVAFAVNQKMKEIGIRKVLGANAFNIIWAFAKNYSFLIILSNLIAWPIAYLVMSDWLQNFAYSVPIGAFEFILAGLLIFSIAIGTVVLIAFKATQMNPVDTLKNE